MNQLLFHGRQRANCSGLSIIETDIVGNAQSANDLLIVLPGALLSGRNPAVELISKSRLVMIVSYGRFETMSSLLDAVEEAMVEAGHTRADVLGSSFGGWVAQCVADSKPQRVRRLILSHTFALRPADAFKFRFGLALWAKIPRSVLIRLISVRSVRALAPVKAFSSERHSEAVRKVQGTLKIPTTFDGIISQNRAMLDSIVNPPATSVTQNSLRPVLILESSDDPLIPAAARRRLREKFPAASVHTFTGSGHVTALAEPEKFASLVETFLS